MIDTAGCRWMDILNRNLVILRVGVEVGFWRIDESHSARSRFHVRARIGKHAPVKQAHQQTMDSNESHCLIQSPID